MVALVGRGQRFSAQVNDAKFAVFLHDIQPDANPLFQFNEDIG